MNPTPFPATGYDAEIRRTVPQYDEFFRIICSAVRSHFPDNPVDWLDVGCGTGRMFEEAAEKIPLRSFAFADSSSAAHGATHIRAPGRRCAQAALISVLKITIRKQKKNTFYAVMNG